VKFLRAACPADLPVNVRRTKMSDALDGDCSFRKEQYHIRVNRTLPEHEAIETLLHEWAHAVAWDRCHDDDHCDEWGKAYSRIYRAFLKEFIDGTEKFC
jgi:hypothetical protein